MSKLHVSSEKECLDVSKEKRKQTNPKFTTFDHSIYTIGDHNDFSLNVCLFFYTHYQNINIDISNLRDTFEYIFRYIKKGHFVFLSKNMNKKLHLPLSNYNFQNPFYENLFFDERDRRNLKKLAKLQKKILTNKDIQNYLYFERKEVNRYFYEHFLKKNRFIHNKNIYLERRLWVSNGCFFRPEKYEGDKFYNLYDFFVDRLYKHIDDKDYVFFMNIRDFPISRKDNTFPYRNIAQNHLFESVRSPIFSLCSTVEHTDIPMPAPDDLRFIYDKEFFPPLYCSPPGKNSKIKWPDKKSIVVFRGSLTGCFTDSSNARINGYKIAKSRKDLFDYGITSLNQRIKKHSPDTPIVIFDNTDIKVSAKMTSEEVTAHKYILVLEGHVAAFRTATQMLSQSCILLQDSKYIMWYSHLIKPYKHYVPVKEDLSDLIDRAEWCLANDSICRQIGISAHALMTKVLTEKFAIDYMMDLFKKNCIFDARNRIEGKKKGALITIYRDTSGSGYRKRQLEQFKNIFRNNTNIDVYVVEQSPDHSFNIGLLKNLGFKLANEKKKYEHFIFSDVDLIPDDELLSCYYNPLSFPIIAAHRGTIYEKLDPTRSLKDYDKKYYEKFFFGGVVIFDKNNFLKTNGYPNQFFGWGGEDDVFLYRVINQKMTIHIPSKGRVIDLEPHGYSIPKKKKLQKDNLEFRNKTKTELYHAYMSESKYIQDGVSTVSKSVKSLSMISQDNNIYHFLADLKTPWPQPKPVGNWLELGAKFNKLLSSKHVRKKFI